MNEIAQAFEVLDPHDVADGGRKPLRLDPDALLVGDGLQFDCVALAVLVIGLQAQVADVMRRRQSDFLCWVRIYLPVKDLWNINSIVIFNFFTS